MLFSPDDYLKQLPLPATETWKNGVWDIEAFRHGSLSLEIFAPKVADYQTPHQQDEWYIVISGYGEFVNEGQRCTFKAGDALFVEAGKEHRFENFSDDFVTWVIFYGPKGGESK
jgi:mannose-6-phosphate isomerase-like protein (cupin superfamily)